MHLPCVPKLIFCLILERKDPGAGILDRPDKGSKNVRVKFQVRKKEDVPKGIPKILYLHQNKKREEIENSQQKVKSGSDK